MKDQFSQLNRTALITNSFSCRQFGVLGCAVRFSPAVSQFSVGTPLVVSVGFVFSAPAFSLPHWVERHNINSRQASCFLHPFFLSSTLSFFNQGYIPLLSEIIPHCVYRITSFSHVFLWQLKLVSSVWFPNYAVMNLLMFSAFSVCSSSSAACCRKLKLWSSSSSKCSLETCCEVYWLQREWVTNLIRNKSRCRVIFFCPFVCTTHQSLLSLVSLVFSWTHTHTKAQ